MIELAIVLFGLSVGSFLNVLIYRLPREDLYISKPARSFCPLCLTQIKWYDNLPVLGWLLLKGRCRFCKGKISVRYPLVELACGILALSVYFNDGLSLKFFIDFYFLICLIGISFIDFELMVIPNVLVFPTIIIGLLTSLFSFNSSLSGEFLNNYLINLGFRQDMVNFVGSLLGLILGWGIFWCISKAYKILRNKEGLGDGDGPLLGMIGVFLGWRSVPFVIFASSIIALIYLVIARSRARQSSDEDVWLEIAIPYGPFLSIAAIIYYFFGEHLINWYSGFFS